MRWDIRIVGRQDNKESCPLPQLGLDPNAPLMAIHNRLDNRQSQAGTHHPVRDVFAAIEFFKDVRLVGRGNAVTGIADLEDNLSILRAR